MGVSDEENTRRKREGDAGENAAQGPIGHIETTFLAGKLLNDSLVPGTGIESVAANAEKTNIIQNTESETDTVGLTPTSSEIGTAVSLMCQETESTP